MTGNHPALRLTVVTGLILVSIYFSLQREFKETAFKTQDDLHEIETFFEAREKRAVLQIGGQLAQLLIRSKEDELQKESLMGATNENWFETLRALFITGIHSSLGVKKQELLLQESLRRFQRINPVERQDLDLYRSQIERLHSPQPGSESERILKEWATTPGPAADLTQIAFFKLVAQKPDPEPTMVEAFKRFFMNPKTQQAGLSLLDGVRNPSVRKSLIHFAISNLRSFHKDHHGTAARILARNIQLVPEEYRKIRSYSASLIKSSDEADIEAGVKALAMLVDFKQFNEEESVKLKSWLEQIPKAKRNPMIEAGIKRLLIKIGRESH